MAVTTCRACGGQPRDGAKFCDTCGARIEAPAAEYKQVTVLFADVVRSMDIAATEGPERLREIMAELLDRSTAVVTRYGGTVDKFTGDGIMAVFGAPISLEDHAFRACMAALEIQRDVGSTIPLRIGLNSGQVIVGEIGSSTASYTSVGQQVGMAQRMESVAPVGGVMLSESTARLVDSGAVLGDSEHVHIKGADEPVCAMRLLAIREERPTRRTQSALVGRAWELNSISALLDEAVGGAGCVVTVVGPAGIGKSRLLREVGAMAGAGNIEVVNTYCESHTRDIPFLVVARLLRAGLGINDIGAEAAREHVHQQFGDADPQDLILLEDLVGIRDDATALPEVAADARRRRLTSLITTAALDRPTPTVYILEDVHWIDEVSESMLADFLAVVPRIPALTLITYRPEYSGPLSRLPGAQTIALRPLNDAQAVTLTTELVGADPDLADLAARVSERAAGNPFFAEEMVRDLAERGVLSGEPGAYCLCGGTDDVDVPATLHATIGARIDRLDPSAKRTLNAAAVIGSRVDEALLSALVDEPDVAPLIAAELIDQVAFGKVVQYAFRHPLIRAVADESQLKADRVRLHRRVAEAIEGRGDPDENASLIAEHLEAAGDLRMAYEWHMRAGAWSNIRDHVAAATSWRRARRVADLLPPTDPDQMTMRISPRTLLCATATLTGGSGAETGYEELRDLCLAADDRHSLATAMAGHALDQLFNGRNIEASRTATALVELLESIGDATLTLALLTSATSIKPQTGELHEALRWADRGVELAAGDPTRGSLMTGSPLTLSLALRGLARSSLGITGWRSDFELAGSLAKSTEPLTRAAAMYFSYIIAIANGILLLTDAVLAEAEEVLRVAEQCGEDVVLAQGYEYLGTLLVRLEGQARTRGLELLDRVRTMAVDQRYNVTIVYLVDALVAQDKARAGDTTGAITLCREAVNGFIRTNDAMWPGFSTNVLVEALVQRGRPADIDEAQLAVERLAACSIEPGVVVFEIWLLRARTVLAKAQGDESTYRSCRNAYRAMATDLGFEGHMMWAQQMP
jgi:adenylate cyclase